ncbi:MAG: hypothetical protein CMJ53_06325 [Planctomycetaceae bacterium]|nr:hypothetical protein [Planctomycetaceae bacterium]
MLAEVDRMKTRLHSLRSFQCQWVASTDQSDDLIGKEDTEIVEINDRPTDLGHRIVSLLGRGFPKKEAVDEDFDGILPVGGSSCRWNRILGTDLLDQLHELGNICNTVLHDSPTSESFWFGSSSRDSMAA